MPPNVDRITDDEEELEDVDTMPQDVAGAVEVENDSDADVEYSEDAVEAENDNLPPESQKNEV